VLGETPRRRAISDWLIGFFAFASRWTSSIRFRCCSNSFPRSWPMLIAGVPPLRSIAMTRSIVLLSK
jgi:hypothetical protein